MPICTPPKRMIMNPKKLTAAILALMLATLSLAGTASASSHSSDTVTTTGAAVGDPLTVTVPVFGTSMVITILTDANGSFVSANLAPSTPVDTTIPTGTDAGFNLSVDSNSSGGFEVKFQNTTAGVEIEIRVSDDAISKVEVEANTAADASGNGIWTGDPLGNGETVTVGYTVGIDASGDPTITIDTVNGTAADLINPGYAGSLTFYQVVGQTPARGDDSESVITQTIQFYNDAGDSMELAITAKADNGELKVESRLVDPNAKRSGDDDESDDDEYENEHEDEDEGRIRSSDSDSNSNSNSDDSSHRGGDDEEDDD